MPAIEPLMPSGCGLEGDKVIFIDPALGKEVQLDCARKTQFSRLFSSIIVSGFALAALHRLHNNPFLALSRTLLNLNTIGP